MMSPCQNTVRWLLMVGSLMLAVVSHTLSLPVSRWLRPTSRA